MENKKGCGCAANKNGPSASDVKIPPQIPNRILGNFRPISGVVHAGPASVEPETSEQKQETIVPEFKSRTVETPTNLKEQLAKKLGMVQSFATAIASRGFADNKINKPTKQLRVLSCFGNKEQGGNLPPCEYLRKSTTPGKHFCGGCGCGDKPHTWLVAEGEQYSKLDYPKLACPLQMPGFSNYEHSKPEEAGPPMTRRHYIENIDYNQIENINVTLPTKEEPPK